MRARSNTQVLAARRGSTLIRLRRKNYLYVFCVGCDSLGRLCQLLRLQRRRDDVDEDHGARIGATSHPCQFGLPGYDQHTHQHQRLGYAPSRNGAADGHIQIGDRFYNGWKMSEMVEAWGLNKFGMETVPPIVTRGVLLDIAWRN